MQSGSLFGKNTICFLTDSAINKIVLHSNGLIIKAITSSDKKLHYEQKNQEEKLIINSFFAPGDTHSLTINYEYDKNHFRSNGRQGFYFYTKNETVLENIAYTMSEPSDARCWYPCWDEPNDKVVTEMRIRVDKNYLAASNGNLESETFDTDSTRIFHWKTYYPITTYLVSFAISKYANFTDNYVAVTDSTKNIKLDYYVWRDDSAGVVFNAVRAFKLVPKMMAAFSNIYCEYPFEKYGMVSVFPFDFGGEEHQSMTTIHRYWLMGDEMGIAHELAHQWWGDMITCRTWKDIWLNESFATYSEYLWLESKTKDKKELKKKLISYERYTPDWNKAIYDPEGQGIKLFSGIVYQKGALVLHTLRSIVGDTCFFKILKEYINKFEYGYADTEDFIRIVNSVTRKDLRWFFNQYIYAKGWPKLLYSTDYDNTTKNLKVSLEQKGNNDDFIYKLPLKIKINSKETLVKDIVFDGENRTQHFDFSIPEEPVSVEINPEKQIFVQIEKKKKI